MEDLRKCVSESLDSFDLELFPHLPYILQDLWSFGADPETMQKLIADHIKEEKLKVLDLGCGKGAVSIPLAESLKCEVTGIDAIPEFISEAILYSKKYGVQDLCRYEVDDIREAIKSTKGFHVVILGAIGPVLGNLQETLTRLKTVLNRPGYVLLDDGYLEDDSKAAYTRALRKSEFYRQIAAAGYHIVQEDLFTKADIEEYDLFVLNSIRKRVHELIIRHPEKKELFLGYLKTQEEETDVMENQLITGTFLFEIRKEE